MLNVSLKLLVAVAGLLHQSYGFVLNNEPDVTSRCPSNVRNGHNNIVTVFNDWCLEFHAQAHVYWADASHTCVSKGGHLVRIESGEMQQFLMTSLNQMQYASHGGQALWIGLNDIDTEGQWVWDNGQPLGGYSNWGPLETYHSPQYPIEDCVVLQYSDNGLWHDKTCHLFVFKADFICQYDATRVAGTTTERTTTTTSTTTPKPTTPTTTPAPPPTTTATTPASTPCPAVDCHSTCGSRGYSGLYFLANGCIACDCL